MTPAKPGRRNEADQSSIAAAAAAAVAPVTANLRLHRLWKCLDESSNSGVVGAVYTWVYPGIRGTFPFFRLVCQSLEKVWKPSEKCPTERIHRPQLEALSCEGGKEGRTEGRKG